MATPKTSERVVSVGKDYVDLLNKIAVKLTAELGKPISKEEACRALIAQWWENNGINCT